MKKTTKLIAILLSAAISAGGIVPVMAADSEKTAKREYVVSEFVQSVGRNNLTINTAQEDTILSAFKDNDTIDEKYREDIARAKAYSLVAGYEDGTLRPQGNVRRIEAMVMLSRALPELEETSELIEFTDVPEWAKADMDRLTKAGLVYGYGDGTLGAEDNITVEQVTMLTDRSDAALNTVDVGESFYGYINNKAFRNHDAGTKTTIDPIHGVVISNEDTWSYFDDLQADISEKETETLAKLLNGELEYEKGSAEQRVHDLYMCRLEGENRLSDTDKEQFNIWKKSILDAKDLQAFFAATDEIYQNTGIGLIISSETGLEQETNTVYPQVSLVAPDGAAFMSFDGKSDKAYEKEYKKAMEDYLKLIGCTFSMNDIDKMYNIQKHFLSGKDFSLDYIIALMLKSMSDESYSEEDAIADFVKVQNLHPDLYGENAPKLEAVDLDYADGLIKNLSVSERLTNAGYHDFDKILLTENSSFSNSKSDISESNLKALKLNAVLTLAEKLSYHENSREQEALERIDEIPLMAITGQDSSVLEGMFGIEATETEESGNASGEEAIALNETILSDIKTLLPYDIALIYCDYYYDDKISYGIGDMMDEIWDAYFKRFENNEWMSEETKEGAIKKINNMQAVIGYPDNYEFPEILSPEEGGTYFSNVISIKKDDLNTNIRYCADQEFIRAVMLMAPDVVNACYIPILNIMNITAAIANSPVMYDPNGSKAKNLGAIGMILGHEIGHAFDAQGSQYDEKGVLKNWWTDEDSEKYEEIKQRFIDYYNDFEVMDGVTQDASVTITENMADFAGMTMIMDILGDDPDAQREALEAYATMWAKIGSASILTSDDYMSDEHAANSVRVNGVVASLDCFYELYDISEDDPMYVAPENRLKLW